MQKQIIRDLINPNVDLKEQKSMVNKVYIIYHRLESDTKVLLDFIKRKNEEGIVVNNLILNTYVSLNHKEIFLDDYFWETEEREVDLGTVTDKLIADELKIMNTDLVKDAYEKFKLDGDTKHFQNLPFKSQSNREDLISTETAVDETLEKLRKIKDKEDSGMIKFSNKQFFSLNLVIKGFEPGEFILIASRPGVGKTSLSISFANDLSKTYNILYVSLEMPVTELTERMLIAKSGVTKNVIHSTSKFTEEEFYKLTRAGEDIKKQRLTFLTKTNNDFLGLSSFIREQQRIENFDVIFIDYLGLIPSYDGKSEDLRTTTTKISRGFKLLAMELGIPIIAAQQVSRNMTHGTRTKAEYIPLQLTDLRDSGALEQDANKVFLLWNLEPETDAEEEKLQQQQKSKLILSIAKNRGGNSGDLILYNYYKSYQRIEEAVWITKPDSFSNKDDDK